MNKESQSPQAEEKALEKKGFLTRFDSSKFAKKVLPYLLAVEALGLVDAWAKAIDIVVDYYQNRHYFSQQFDNAWLSEIPQNEHRKDVLEENVIGDANFDENGYLIGYFFKGGDYCPVDKNKHIEAKEKAMTNGTLEPFAFVSGEIDKCPEGFYGGRPEQIHFFQFEKPDDVLTDQELKDKGIRIIQGEQTKLSIRECFF